jgi:cytochrome c-type biogenesis protein CcmH/NrfF
VPLGVTALIMLAIIAAAVCPAGASSSRIKSVTEQEVSQALTCQCGCGLTVANCNHPNCSFSVPIRTQIEAMIDKGMGRLQIVAFFRHKYGEKILSAPTTQGFNLLAWLMPFFAIAVGCGIVLFTVGRWRSASASAPAGSSEPQSPPEFDSRLRHKLEQELRERI